MNLSSSRWYVILSTGVAGPYSFKEIKTLMHQSMVTEETLVCREGEDQWHPAVLGLPKLKALRAARPLSGRRRRTPLLTEFINGMGCILAAVGIVGWLTTVVALPAAFAMTVGGVLLMVASTLI